MADKFVLLTMPTGPGLVSPAVGLTDTGSTLDGETLYAVQTRATLGAGELHLGEVGGNGDVVTVTPTVSTSPAYASGDSIGGKWTISGALRTAGKTAVWQSLSMLDKGNQKPAGDLFIFRTDPTAATLTDNAAAVFSTNDVDVVARVTVAASDWVTVNSKAYLSLSNLGRVLKASSGTTLYAAFVTTSTPTFASTSDITAHFGFLRD